MSMIAFLYSPFPTQEAAMKAARALLEKKLVACCNLLPAGQSLYGWEGKIESASEIILIAKTTTKGADKARQALAENHPYDCPAILIFAPDSNDTYAAWVKENVALHQ